MTYEVFHGLPAHRLTLDNGDTVCVAQQGAQVLSWVSAGRERLYLSTGNLFDGHTAIRGGVPVCFPQFNMRGSLPKHGFVRNLPWVLDAAAHDALHDKPQGAHSLCFVLQDSAATHVHWDTSFHAALTITLAPAELRMDLTVKNTGTQDWSFTGALHTYLAVQDIQNVSLEGLGGQAEWDALTDRHAQAQTVLRMEGEFDRVYRAALQPLRLAEPGLGLLISQSESWANTVVWNPGPHKLLADMPEGDHARMLCVEAAQVFEPVLVPAGQVWQGWQLLQVSHEVQCITPSSVSKASLRSSPPA